VWEVRQWVSGKERTLQPQKYWKEEGGAGVDNGESSSSVRERESRLQGERERVQVAAREDFKTVQTV